MPTGIYKSDKRVTFEKGMTPWNKGIKCPSISKSKIGKK